MEDPVSDIPQVIHLLTQSPPSTQLDTLNRYFTPAASFTHPFIRTGSWDIGYGCTSRWAMGRVYRWYKIMSPWIDLSVNSVAFDQPNKILYVGVEQSFRIVPVMWLGYNANVSLTAKLHLIQEDGEKKWYITSQEDLYQTTEFAKFVWFGVWWFVWLWQILSTVICVLLAFIGSPISWLEERYQVGEVKEVPKVNGTSWQDEWANSWEKSTWNKVNGEKQHSIPNGPIRPIKH